MLPQEITPPVVAAGPFEALNWFDWSAISIVLVFLSIGMFKGLAWQAGRLAILGLAYVVPFFFGRSFGDALRGWLPESADPALPYYIANSTMFLAVLTVVGLLVWMLQKAVEHSPLSLGNRVAGGVTGGLFGGLLVLAGLTASQMFLGEGRIARAAESSEAARVGRQAIAVAETLLPDDLADTARRWRRVLRDPALEAFDPSSLPAGPTDADFRPTDGAGPFDAGR